MKCKAYICDVLFREFYYWSALSPHGVDIEIISSEYHEQPEKIHGLLQAKINALAAQPAGYDYILLGFGLCGKVLEGLTSRNVPLVVPRAHDCITLFMGSKERFAGYFLNNPGTMYYIAAWLERNGIKKERKELDSIGLGGSLAELVEKYGEENARYLWEIAGEWQRRYKQALYIQNRLTGKNFSGEVKALAAARNWRYQEMPGDDSLIKRLAGGQWTDEDFLIVGENCTIYQTADSSILACRPQPNTARQQLQCGEKDGKT